MRVELDKLENEIDKSKRSRESMNRYLESYSPVIINKKSGNYMKIQNNRYNNRNIGNAPLNQQI